MKKILLLLVILFPFYLNAQNVTEHPIQTEFLGKYSFGETINEEVLCLKYNESYNPRFPKFPYIQEGNTYGYKIESDYRFGGFLWDDIYIYTVNSRLVEISFVISDYTDSYQENFNKIKNLFTQKYGEPNRNNDSNHLFWNDCYGKQIMLSMIPKTFVYDYFEITLSYIDLDIYKEVVVGIDEI